MSNPLNPNENPGATAIATGAKDHAKRDISLIYDTPKDGAYAIIDWAKAFTELLNEAERVALAWTALRRLDCGEAELTCRDVLGGIDRPLPTFISPMSDARWWASYANRAELKA